MASKCRQNYHEDCEALINKQINNKQNIALQYLAMHAYFDRDDVALKGFAKFFKDCAEDQHEYVEKLIKYQNLRGGRVVLKETVAPAAQEWATPLAAIELAMEMEKQRNDDLLSLHKVADAHKDPHLCDYLEKHFLDEVVEEINELAKMHTNLLRVGDGLGVYIFDRELQS